MLLGSVLAGMNLVALADPSLGELDPRVMLAETLLPMFYAIWLLACWLPADRSASDAPRRFGRLATAVLLATVLCSLLTPLLVQALDLQTAMQMAYARKGKAPPSWLTVFLAGSMANLIPAGLAVAVLEMAGRQRRSEKAVVQALGEHARLARAALESRLAAMQAQVEPRFLFDVLVDIERLYAGNPAAPASADRSAAVEQMERLITYLRVALPKLRETGSTLGAEVELLGSYLDLVQAMHEGRPQFTSRVPPELSATLFHPMLLLPLVQRAVRSAQALPRQIDLQAAQRDGRLQLVLSITAPDLCRSDDELQSLRDRLQVLYDGKASLTCEDLATQDPPGGEVSAGPGMRVSRFTMELAA